MRNRRFLILAAVLVTLNVGLWLAPGALGVSQTVIAKLFGMNMVRATVLEHNGVQWNLDRGTVASATSVLLTINESDGRVQPIPVSSSTVVNAGYAGKLLPVRRLGTGWRVLVQWPANGGPAKTVWIEKRGKPKSGLRPAAQHS
ncbi:MAG TPA: hypothetical protein VMU72_06635 [Gaiellaceae bacterium]|nr:hypothetical protein [Gaiellaceae bacterium]